MPEIPSGGLRQAMVERTETALASGALQPIETVTEKIRDAGVCFRVHVVSSLRRKDEDVAVQRRPRSRRNPFLPFDERLLVAELSDTHVCLLNKFNVIERHLLLVTRRFENQELPLTLQDFEAAVLCLAEVDGLVFYNSGKIAGASQPHRHLQLVPLPLAAEYEDLPLGDRIRRAAAGDRSALQFPHAAVELAETAGKRSELRAEYLRDCYFRLLRDTRLAVHLPPDPTAPLPPYNLLMTRDWMLCVPRWIESWHGISLNALGFAGSLFLRSGKQLTALRGLGPMRLLIMLAGQERPPAR